MKDRDNLPGFLLLGLCAIVGVALILEITTGIEFQFRGPNWAGNGLTLVYIGLVVAIFVMGRKIGRIGKVGGPRRWPWQRRDDDRPSPPSA